MDINDAWKATCRVLLGDEIGELSTYKDYLMRYVDEVEEKPSAISGKKVAVTASDVCQSARFISNDEAEEYNKQMEKLGLDINEIKDLDSLLGAVSRRLYYGGNIILGNSRHVERANRCMNASFVYDCTDIYDSKYVAFSCSVRYGEWIFGSNWVGETKFGIKNYETFNQVRCMETISTYNSSDCYFTGHVDGCSNCMFCFNVKNRKYSIGNVQLSRDEYFRLKEKLLEDMRETFVAKKAIPTIIEIIRE